MFQEDSTGKYEDGEKEARLAGMEAFKNGKRIEGNPYNEETQSQLFDWWEDGWFDAHKSQSGKKTNEVK